MGRSRGGSGSKRAGSKLATGGAGVGGAGSGVSGACTGSGGFSVVGLLRFPSSRPSAVGRIHHGFKILAPSWRARGGLVVGHVQSGKRLTRYERQRTGVVARATAAGGGPAGQGRVFPQALWEDKIFERRGPFPLIEIERAGGGAPLRVFLGPAHGLAELLLEDAVAVLQGGDLALEDVLGPALLLVEPLEQRVEVLAAGDRLLGLAVGEDGARGGVDHQVGAAVGAADGQLAGVFGHGLIMASISPHLLAYAHAR